MKKYAVLSILSIAMTGFGLLACAGPGTSAADSIPGNINAAFKQVVQVLHAPYDKGDLFFRIFKGDTATNERKNGWDSTKVGAGDGTGSGSWTVKAGSQSTNISNGTPMVSTKRDSIIYVYNNYQPKGSHIKIDGTMAAMYRSKMKDLTPVTSMGTTLSNAIDSQFSDSIGDSLKNTIGSTHVDAISAALKNAIGDAPVAAIGASIANVLGISSSDCIQFNKFGAAAITKIFIDTRTASVASKAIGGAGMVVASGKKSAMAMAIEDAAIAADKAIEDGIGNMIEILNITGAYNATLKFTYTGNDIHTAITESNYDEYLFSEDNGLFKTAGSKIEFTYAGQTITLNKDQLKTLLRVVKT